MNLFKEILVWSNKSPNKLPNWQRDALRRLFQLKNTLTENDYNELYILLKNNKLSGKPLNKSHYPDAIQLGSTILQELGELTHVNCIDPNQKLEFSEKGMSIIYGKNGSGKSGYVRVIKQVCRYRGEEEKVYPDVYDTTSGNKTPTAKFKIKKDNSIYTIKWKNGDPPDERLSSISVFDLRCARSYLADKWEVAYPPYGLDILENLASDVIPELKRRIEEEIKTIDITNAFSHLQGETKVGKLISKLSSKTDPEYVNALGALSELEEKRIVDLSKTLAKSDPIIEAENLKRFASRLKFAAENVKRVESLINDAAVNNLQNADGEMVDAEDAEQNATRVLFGEELLPGTGEPLWKALFEAAKKYSEVAYPKKKFPYTGNDAVCLLCQTPLLNEAGERLKLFEKYIKDNVAKTAKKRRDDLAKFRKEIMNANLSITPDQELSEEIGKSNDDIVHAIKEYQTNIHEKQKWMLGALDNHDWSNPPDLAGSLYFDLHKLADQSLREAHTLIKEADKKYKKKLEQEHRELIARQSLQKLQQGVLDLIGRMKEVEALIKCHKDLQTNSITNKSKKIASNLVTKKLESNLDDEVREFGVDNTKIKLKCNSAKAKIFYEILLNASTNKNICDILSEGEQSAIALGAFLAELSLANHSCGIVFDDPMSSLDLFYQQKVAERLVTEAKKRQVIVFTHDKYFYNYLYNESIKQGINPKTCCLE